MLRYIHPGIVTGANSFCTLIQQCCYTNCVTPLQLTDGKGKHGIAHSIPHGDVTALELFDNTSALSWVAKTPGRISNRN